VGQERQGACRGGVTTPHPSILRLILSAAAFKLAAASPTLLFRVCVYYCSAYYKAVREGGGGGMEDMCYERLRAEADVN
jgi:hypothetical protein